MSRAAFVVLLASLTALRAQAVQASVSLARAAAELQLRPKAANLARYLSHDLGWLFQPDVEPLGFATAARSRLVQLADDFDDEDGLGARLLRRYALTAPNYLLIPYQPAAYAEEPEATALKTSNASDVSLEERVVGRDREGNYVTHVRSCKDGRCTETTRSSRSPPLAQGEMLEQMSGFGGAVDDFVRGLKSMDVLFGPDFMDSEMAFVEPVQNLLVGGYSPSQSSDVQQPGNLTAQTMLGTLQGVARHLAKEIAPAINGTVLAEQVGSAAMNSTNYSKSIGDIAASTWRNLQAPLAQMVLDAGLPSLQVPQVHDAFRSAFDSLGNATLMKTESQLGVNGKVIRRTQVCMGANCTETVEELTPASLNVEGNETVF